MEDSEAAGVSDIVSNLIGVFPRSALTALPGDLFASFIAGLTLLTCSFGRSAALEEALHKDDVVYTKAYDQLLEAWLTLVQDEEHFPRGCFVQPAVQVFNSYIQCHLAAPDGTRAQPVSGTSSPTEEDDRELFSDQPCSIGVLGRVAADHCVPLLASLLEDRVSRLHGELQRTRLHLEASADPGSAGREVLDDLYEDIHWLLLVSGYLLADCEGDAPGIPSQVMEFSIRHSAEVEMDATLQEEKSWTAPRCGRKDSVIRLLSAVLRTSEVESRAAAAGLTALLSPQMAKDIVWFLRRWTETYLPMEEKLTEQIGLPLSAARWMVRYLLEKVTDNLSAWSSEAELANDTVELLVTLVEKRERAAVVVRCESWWDLATRFAARRPPLHLLSGTAQTALMKTLVLGGVTHMDADAKQQYWAEVLRPLRQRFLDLVNRDDFAQISQQEAVRREVVATLEALCGIAEATQVDNVAALFSFLVDFLSGCIGLMEVYSNTPETINLIIEVFVEVAHKQICYLGETKSTELYEACLTLLQVYAKNNRSSGRQHAPPQEEDQYQDLLLIMELLTNLLSKEFIDFSDSDEVFRNPDQGAPAPGRTVSAVDVVLYGVNIVLPLMSQDLLKFPSLCNQYYKLITFMCEIFPEKIPQLPEDLFKSLMVSLELGLTSMSSEVSQLCLEALSPLAEQCAKNHEKDTPLFVATCHFLKLVFDMLLLQKHNKEMTVAAGEALYTLVCLHQAEYSGLVEALLSSQRDAVVYRRLAAAFDKLTAGSSPPATEREQKVAFLKSLEGFVADVGGLLCVK
ncbi:exportin-4-like isoform X1 [Pseudoliparis swirei]|nr:exportin-4-like isoform X1 [Pseudoliparis swirei]